MTKLNLSSVADFLVVGMNMPPLDTPPVKLSQPAYDALSGEPITHGYPLWSVVPDSAGEYLESFHAMTGKYLSENSARAIKNCWHMGSRLIFEDGVGHHPLIASIAAAAQGRACWSSLVREVWRTRRGQRMICILTTDTKPRLWTKARVGVLSSSQTEAYIHSPDMHISGSFRIDWAEMLTYLDQIEELYQFFVKPVIGRNLLSALENAKVYGLSRAIQVERTLSTLRAQPAWIFAYLIAQKKDSVENDTD